MAGVFIDIPGIGNVEAKNAATEATLREILKALGGGRGGGGGGGPGGGGGQGGGGGAGGAGGGGGAGAVLGKSFNLLGKGVGVATGLIGKMGTIAGFAANKTVKFSDATFDAAEKLANLGNSATSAAGLFKSVPLLGTAFSAVAAAADDVVKSYTAVSQSGASFGGSISNFAKASSEAGMTMAEFSGIVKSNAQGMLGFGGTVESGAANFAKVSKQVRATGSDLYALGFSTQEINAGLANYGALLRTQGLQGKKSNAELAAGASKYLKEMDALAKITGEERSQKEAQAKQLAADAQFAASMAGMNEEVRASFRDTVLGLPGPLQSFTKDMLANGVATTEENQKLMAMMPQSAAMMQKLNAKMQRGEQVTMEERNALNNLMKQEGAKNLKNIKQAGAASAELSGMVQGLAATQQINSDAVKEATEEQKKAKAETDKMNEKMQSFQSRIAEVSNQFKILLANSGIMDVLIMAFDGLAKLANQYLVPAFNIVTSIVMKVANGMSLMLAPVLDYISEKFGASGLGGTVEWIDGIMNSAFDFLAGAVRGAILAFDGLWDGVMALVDPFKGLMDAVFGAGEGAGSFGEILIDVGAFVGDALRVFGKALGWVIELITPVVKAVVDIFKWLWNTTKTVIGFFSNLGDYLTDFGDFLSELIDGILVAIPNAMGGISKEEKQKRDEARAAAKETREAEKKAQQESKVKDAEKHKAELADDKKKFAEKKVTSDKVTGLAKKEADAKEAAVKAQEKLNSVDYTAGPEEMLKQFNTKEGGILDPNSKKAEAQAALKNVKTEAASSADTAKTAIAMDAEKKNQEAAKAKEEADKKSKEEATKAKEESEKKKTTQESAETLLAELNTKMGQLLKINQEQKDINERQLTAAKGMTKNLFA